MSNSFPKTGTGNHLYASIVKGIRAEFHGDGYEVLIGQIAADGNCMLPHHI